MADAHLPVADGGAQQRTLAQLAREAHILVRRARRHPDHLPGIVDDACAAGDAHRVVTPAQSIEALSDCDVDRAMPSRHHGEQRVDQAHRLVARRLVPLARQRPRDHRCRSRERLEASVEGIGKMRESFAHVLIVAAPSDTRSP